MTEPRYQGLEASQIPEVEAGGPRIRVIAGRVGDVAGPVSDAFVEPEYLDVALRPGATWEYPTMPGHTVLRLRLRGGGRLRRRWRPRGLPTRGGSCCSETATR